nr:MAG TPA: hypothetical protein [Caudoviricetes sp.]
MLGVWSLHSKVILIYPAEFLSCFFILLVIKL